MPYKNFSAHGKKYLKVKKMHKKIRITLIVFSIFPPGTIGPRDFTLKGQKGFVPRTVRLSKNRWKEYPKKNGKAKRG